MSILYVALFIILSSAILGFIKIYNKHKKEKSELKFYLLYYGKFKQLCDKFTNQMDDDDVLYIWLTKNLSKITKQMGPRFENVIAYTDHNGTVYNYPMLQNILPKFRTFPPVSSNEIKWTEDCFFRYAGDKEECVETMRKKLSKPFKLIKEGLVIIIELPLRFLKSIGVVDNSISNRIKDTFLYKTFSIILQCIATFFISTYFSQIVEFFNSYCF